MKIKCPACFSQKVSFRFQGEDVYEKEASGRFSYYQCDNCDSIFIWPLPQPREISTFYPSDYYAYKESSKKGFLTELREKVVITGYEGYQGENLFWRLLIPLIRGKFVDILPARLVGSGKFLDVGCGNGRDLELLGKYGWEAHGIEIDRRVAEGAKRRGLKVEWTSLEDYEPKERFDVIKLWHVFEHLPNPHLALRKLNDILKDNGTIYMALPNIRSLNAFLFRRYWMGFEIPRHIINYSRNGLEFVLKEHGFQIVGYAYSSTSGLISSISVLASKILNKKCRLADSIPLVVLTYPYDFFTDLLHLGDTVFVKIRRRGTNYR